MPERSAPAALETRVLRELARRAARPWWRRSFSAWPAAARAGFVGLSLAAAVLIMEILRGQAEPAILADIRLFGAALAILGSVLENAGRSVVSAIPTYWAYGILALIVGSYVALAGIGAAIFRTFGLRPVRA